MFKHPVHSIFSILGSKVSALQQDILAKVDEIENGKAALIEKEEQLKSLKETIEG